ncbi:hypothetical protein DIPPA_35829 [Diplonema papillatum]|nr:hypothetical protein DIPPA_35829 [Diplonema papillatum]
MDPADGVLEPAPASPLDKTPAGPKEAERVFKDVLLNLDENGDRTVTAGEVRNMLRHCSSEVAHHLGSLVTQHADTVYTYDNFKRLCEEALAIEGLTMETVSKDQLRYFREVFDQIKVTPQPDNPFV